MSKFCERCGKEHDGSYGSGRFCSKKCANSRKLNGEQIKKISFSLKEYYNRLEKVGRKCKTCGKIFYSKDNSRKECFDCLPSTIKYAKTDKHIDSILDLSKRTVGKVLKRLDLPSYILTIWCVVQLRTKKNTNLNMLLRKEQTEQMLL